MRFVIIAFMLLLISQSTVESQEVKTLCRDADAPRPFHGNQSLLRGFASSTEARQVVGRILAAVGIDKHNYLVVEVPDLPNAAAYICGDVRIIGYNRDFMQSILKSTGRNYYALIGIMAHEIGHHFAAHTADITRAPSANLSERVAPRLRDLLEIRPRSAGSGDLLESRRQDELQADKFSGFALGMLGANKDDAIAWLNGIPDPGQNSTHPGPKQREEAITAGWRLSAERVAGWPGQVPPPPTSRGQYSLCQAIGVSDNLKIRREPNGDAEIVYAMAAKATGIEVDLSTCHRPSDSSANWCFITFSGHQGWSAQRFLGECRPSGISRPQVVSCNVEGVSDDLKIRTGPGIEFPQVYAMPADAQGVAVDSAKCQTDSEGGRWCRVRYLNYHGWAFSGFLGRCK